MDLFYLLDISHNILIYCISYCIYPVLFCSVELLTIEGRKCWVASLKSVLRDRHSIISVHSPLLFVFPTNNDDQDPGPHSPLRSVLALNDSNHIFWKFIAGVAWLFETTFSICCKHNSTCKRYNLVWTHSHFACVTHIYIFIQNSNGSTINCLECLEDKNYFA